MCLLLFNNKETKKTLFRGFLKWVSGRIPDIERSIVTLAAILALWPLYEWYSEREARRLERIAGLIEANIACEDLKRSEGLSIDAGEVKKAYKGQVSSSYLMKANLDLMCFEVAMATVRDDIPIEVLEELGEEVKAVVQSLKARHSVDDK